MRPSLLNLLKALGFVRCDECAGTGDVEGSECVACEGSGVVRAQPSERLVVPHDDLRPEGF